MGRAIRLGWTVFAGLAFLGVCLLTLVPAPGSLVAIRATPWWCISCGASGSADLFQNLLLLIPLGFALARMGISRRRALPLLLLLPVGIEVAQALWITGRDATLGDVLANGSGGVLGFWFGVRARLPVRGARHGWRWAALMLGLFVAQLLATSSLVAPSLRGGQPAQLRLAPEGIGKPVYRGTFMALGRNGRAILNASDADAQGDAQTHMTWTAGFTWQDTDAGTLTPLVRLDDAHDWPLFALDLRHRAVGVEVRTLGGVLRFRTPTWLAPVPPRIAPRDTVTVRYVASPGRVLVRTTVHGITVQHLFPVGAQHGWSLINPFTPAHGNPTVWHRWTLAWLAGWGLLLGLSAAPMRVRWPWAVVAVVALVAATMWSGTLIGIDEGAALVVAWLIGLWLSSAAAAHRRPDGDAGTRSRPPVAPASR
ncbi:MAG TPA: VanZ family protein [Gemmatimonadales bacterium]|nr:VanZ family protein [Gemmatimonadales bacterium]